MGFLCYTNSSFKFLIGEWYLERFVLSQSEIFYTMKGSVLFTKLERNKLLYREEVFYKVPETDNDIKGYRKYIYHLKNKKEIDVYFYQSSTLFHQLLSSNRGLAEAQHFCRQDLYKGFYDFRLEDNIKISYHVLGPHKDYIITTNLKRII